MFHSLPNDKIVYLSKFDPFLHIYAFKYNEENSFGKTWGNIVEKGKIA